MWSGASESLDLLLSHSAITLAYHKHHTHIYPLFDTKNWPHHLHYRYQPGSSSGSGRSRGDTSEEHRSTRASESGAPERDKVKKTGNSSDKRSKLGNRDDTKIITSSKGRGREKGEKGEKDTKKEVKDPSKDPSRFIGKNTLQYALWAHRMSYISAGMCLVMGAFAVAWTGKNARILEY